jgi:hypothetical protein
MARSGRSRREERDPMSGSGSTRTVFNGEKLKSFSSFWMICFSVKGSIFLTFGNFLSKKNKDFRKFLERGYFLTQENSSF